MKMRALVLFGSMALAPVAFAQGVNDAQIAAIVVTANQVDIDAGKLAESMGSSAEVKTFGKDMVRDHTGVNKSAVDLGHQNTQGHTGRQCDSAMSLKKGGMDNVDSLKTMKGKAFDKAYIDHQVAYHEQVLEAMDKTLIPGREE